jgi:hypothetical protein
VFRCILENAAKVPDDIRWRHCASGDWTVSLAKGRLRLCANLVKGFIRVLWRGFRGDDPSWPRFDRCLTGLTRLIRSLALMTVIKNLGCHTNSAYSSNRSVTDRPTSFGLKFWIWPFFWFSVKLDW